MKGNQPIPNHSRSRSKVWLIITIILVVVLVIPLIAAVIVFFTFYNSNFKKKKGIPGVSTEQVLTEVMVDSLDYAKDESKIRVRLTEAVLNQLLYTAMEDMYKESGGIIDNFYIDITKSNYNFYLQVNALNFFKTIVCISTKLSVNDTNIVFKIGDICVGHAHGMQKSLNTIFSIANIDLKGLEAELNANFKDAGLSMTLNLTKLEINYAKADFYNDITNKFLPGGDDSYSAIFKEMIGNTELHSFLPNSEEAIELQMHLDKMKANAEVFGIDGYVVPDGYMSTYSEAAKTKVLGYLENEKISVENASSVFKYYVVGYDHLQNNEKTVVDTYLSSGNITSAADTYDFNVPEEESLKMIAEKQINEQISGIVPGIPATYPTRIDVDFTTSQLDRMLSSSNILGSATTMSVKKYSGGYKCNYVVISRLTTVLHENSFYFVISVNLNGCEIHLTLETEKVTNNGFGELSFKTKDMYLGKYKISDTTKNAFVELIKESIENGSFNDCAEIKAIGDELYFSVSLKSIYDEYGVGEIKVITDENFNSEFGLSSNTSSTAGNIRFSVIKK